MAGSRLSSGSARLSERLGDAKREVRVVAVAQGSGEGVGVSGAGGWGEMPGERTLILTFVLTPLGRQVPG